MELIDIQINTLSNNIFTLIERYRELKEKNIQLEEELSKKVDNYNKLKSNYKGLEDEIKQLKMVNAMSGSEEYRRIMKLQLNKLIKEIDICMGQLTNQ